MKQKLLCILAVIALIAASLPGTAYSAGNGEDSYSGFYNIGSNPSVTITPESSAGETVSEVTVDIDGDGVEDTVFNNSDKLKVELQGTESGAQYMIMLVEGDSIPTASSTIYYIDQAAGGGTITFNVFPKLSSKNTVLSLIITSSATGFTTIMIPVSYATSGYSVSGTAVFWDAVDNAEYYLFAEDVTETDIISAWRSNTLSELSGATEYEVTKEAVAAVTLDGKTMNGQSFSFESVMAGEYKLVIAKAGKYAPKIITVTVADEAVELGNAKLWLYGDVNYDGVTDSKDATQITRYANLKTSIFTTGDEATKADRLIAADVTGDGAVDSKDATQVTRYANIKTSIFDKLK